jgi:hypothetical protein
MANASAGHRGRLQSSRGESFAGCHPRHETTDWRTTLWIGTRGANIQQARADDLLAAARATSLLDGSDRFMVESIRRTALRELRHAIAARALFFVPEKVSRHERADRAQRDLGSGVHGRNPL